MSNTETYHMPYSDEFLVNRALGNLEGTKKTNFVKPKISRMNKKTFIDNFEDVCKSLNRDPEILREYYEKSLALAAGDVTLSATNVLTITGSHADPNLMKHLTDYTTAYVICTEKGCGSSNTELIKENRILWMSCKKCFCKKAVSKF